MNHVATCLARKASATVSTDRISVWSSEGEGDAVNTCRSMSPAFWISTRVLGAGTMPVRNCLRDCCSRGDRPDEKRTVDERYR